ncbi:MAG TPA: DUF3280 domain-containing protein [Methylocystis sp.]|nr:DUF3280 domain-containing protein [Methylocystis sp.]
MKEHLLALGALLVLASAPAVAAPRLLVLDFELVDTSNEPIDRRDEHARRLAAVHDYLAKAIAARGVYEVVDSGVVRAKIDAVLAHQYLRSCNGCQIELAREAGADFVMLGRFNKISTLIGSMDILIQDVKTQAPIYHQTFGFRGDTDEAWLRAAKFYAGTLKLKSDQEPKGSR